MRSNVTSLSKFLSVLLVITVLSIVANATFGKYFENFLFQGNTIQATNTNGSIVLRPAGSGTVDYYGKGTVMGTSTTDIVANKSFTDSVNYFTDNSDSSKKLQFELSGVTASTTRTVTIPDASGEMVLKDNVQALTNKFLQDANLQGNTITVASRYVDGDSNYVEVKSPAAMSANYTLTFPAVAPTADTVRIFAADGSSTFVGGQTAWVAYTPTFTGFGTATNINFRSRRNGANLDIIGSFTSGTSTVTEGRITLGFNGTSANVTSASWFATTQIVGHGTFSVNSATMPTVLCEASVTYLTLGLQGASNSGLTKVNGSIFASSGTTFRFFASVPINGW